MGFEGLRVGIGVFLGDVVGCDLVECECCGLVISCLFCCFVFT